MHRYAIEKGDYTTEKMVRINIVTQIIGRCARGKKGGANQKKKGNGRGVLGKEGRTG